MRKDTESNSEGERKEGQKRTKDGWMNEMDKTKQMIGIAREGRKEGKKSGEGRKEEGRRA